MRLRRPGEIDYYEELGVDRKAAPQEVRDSFRALARLLHPDRQQDEHLKVIAERQLRRVNRIYAVLSDPERRRRYDELLDEEFRPPAPVFKPLRRVSGNFTQAQLISRFGWIGGAAAGVLLVIWFATEQPSPPPYSPERGIVSAHVLTPSQPVARPAPAAVQDQVLSLKSELQTARLERDEARREVVWLQQRRAGVAIAEFARENPQAPPTSSSSEIADLSPPRILLEPRILEPRAAPGSLAPALRNLKPQGYDAHQFAGFWYFARTSGQRPKNLYPPEFIEATLTEQNGVIHGRYRSRYQIVDRAISPDVNFEFTGTPNGPTIDCTWSGNGGAHGAITLHMNDENDLKVDWSASEIGNVQGLASGTAVLTRRIE